jgi:RNA polymerase sigma-70 factor (sigma-E family)
MRPDFREYVVARSPALLRTAYLLTGDATEAEDLLQEALLRLARHWTRVEHSSSLDAYARRTMINLRTSRWRRRRVVTVSSGDRPEISGAGDPATGIVERDEMWTSLATLPPRMRAVLVLRFYEDLSEADTAAELGCSVGTVKSQTSRGLAKLREALPERTSRC